MQTYLKTDAIKKRYNEKNDCSVKAIAITCNVAYGVAHKAMELQGRRRRDGTNHTAIQNAIRSLGYDYTPVPTKKRVLNVAGLESCLELKKGYFYVLIPNHIVSIVDGKVEDWTAEEGERTRPLDSMIYRVVPVKSRKERKAMAKALFA